MRKNFSNEFKVRAVIALLKEDKTASQLSGELGVHPGQLSQWKKMFLDHAQGAFQGKVKSDSSISAKQLNELYEEIGRMRMELAWYKKKFAS